MSFSMFDIVTLLVHEYCWTVKKIQDLAESDPIGLLYIVRTTLERLDCLEEE